MNLVPFIITKVVHDLAGCAGAVLNTSELLAMDTESVREVAPLLNESAQMLVVRLKFFRCLFGSKTDVPTDIAAKYIKTLSMPYELNGDFITPLDLGFVLAALDCLPKGGTIERMDNGVCLSGPVVQNPDCLASVLQGNDELLAPHSAVFYWLKEQADIARKTLVVQQMGNQLFILIK